MNFHLREFRLNILADQPNWYLKSFCEEFSMPITRMRTMALMLAIAALLIAGSISAQQIHQQTKIAITPAVPEVARPLPLSAVRLTGGPLKHAQQLDADYLLKLEP